MNFDGYTESNKIKRILTFGLLHAAFIAFHDNIL